MRFNFFSCNDAMIQDWVYTNAVGHENSRWTPIELMKEEKVNRRVTKELSEIRRDDDPWRGVGGRWRVLA